MKMTPNQIVESMMRDLRRTPNGSLSNRAIGEIVAILERLENDNGDAGADAAGRFYDAFPYFLDYDNRGNWIGNVANENGWTA